jgi:hypothetical protein
VRGLSTSRGVCFVVINGNGYPVHKHKDCAEDSDRWLQAFQIDASFQLSIIVGAAAASALPFPSRPTKLFLRQQYSSSRAACHTTEKGPVSLASKCAACSSTRFAVSQTAQPCKWQSMTIRTPHAWQCRLGDWNARSVCISHSLDAETLGTAACRTPSLGAFLASR